MPAPRRRGSTRPTPGRPEASTRPPDVRPRPSGEKLTIAEVCAELKVSRSTFYYWRQIGKAPQCLVLPNREVRILRSDLEQWLESCVEGV